MKIKVTNNFIQVVEGTSEELEQLQISFKKKIDNWKFHPLVRRKLWDGTISFIDKHLRIPIGLWNELLKFSEKYGYSISNLESLAPYIYDEEPTDFETWVSEMFAESKVKPRDYQIETAQNILRYRKSINELATSAGKTLIMFLVFGYLKTKFPGQKFCIIVPNTNLIMQTIEEFQEYSKGTNFRFKFQMFYGGKDKVPQDVDLYIGTFQTLRNFSEDFFENITYLCIDEAHTTLTESVKKIIKKCTKLSKIFGLSGTPQKKSECDFFSLQQYLGPIVNEVSAAYLASRKFVTPIKIKVMYLDYVEPKIKSDLSVLRRSGDVDGTQMYAFEKNIVIESKKRFDFLVKLISKVTKNTLVLFSNIKDSYGKKILEAIKELHGDSKVLYYVDGSTPVSSREFIIEDMENGTNKILFASFGTFSTGISIKNIHNIFFVESYKSEKIIRQSIGRGMRLLEGKEAVNVIDIVDDFCFGNEYNLLYRHGKERIKIYNEQGFEYSEIRIKL